MKTPVQEHATAEPASPETLKQKSVRLFFSTMSTLTALPQRLVSGLTEGINRLLGGFTEQVPHAQLKTRGQEHEQHELQHNHQHDVQLEQFSDQELGTALINNSSFGVFAPEELQPGTIFGKAHHEPYSKHRRFGSTPNLTPTKFGDVHSKYRKFVVISRHKSNVVALPVYTYQGTGLSRKHNKDEYVTIREIGFMQTAKRGGFQHGTIWAQ
jgi:Family of unknown function (DUF6590)